MTNRNDELNRIKDAVDAGIMTKEEGVLEYLCGMVDGKLGPEENTDIAPWFETDGAHLKAELEKTKENFKVDTKSSSGSLSPVRVTPRATRKSWPRLHRTTEPKLRKQLRRSRGLKSATGCGGNGLRVRTR